jgi:hypothetical protein
LNQFELFSNIPQGDGMSADHSGNHPTEHEEDVVESIVHQIPIVIPVAGAALIFLLAFIAVSMA